MIEVEEDVYGVPATTDLDPFAAHDGRERGDALLTVEEEFLATEGRLLLFDGGCSGRNVTIGLPYEDAAAGVATIERVEEIPDSGGSPDVAPLEFG
jgi:hypothetical protein